MARLRDLASRTVPALITGGGMGVLLAIEEWQIRDSASDLGGIGWWYPLWTLPLVVIVPYAVLQLCFVWPVVSHLARRARAQLAASIGLAVVVSQLMAAVFYAPEVDTWLEVSAAMLALFGLPVLLMALLSMALLRRRTGAA